MNAVTMAALALKSPSWKASWEIIAAARAGNVTETTEALRPHLDALERLHRHLVKHAPGSTEQESALQFIMLWETRESVPDMFLGLMGATVHRWMMTPPIVERASRLTRETGEPVRDELGDVHCPCGSCTPKVFSDPLPLVRCRICMASSPAPALRGESPKVLASSDLYDRAWNDRCARCNLTRAAHDPAFQIEKACEEFVEEGMCVTGCGVPVEPDSQKCAPCNDLPGERT